MCIRDSTTLLLYRNGFYVGKYISLEAKIAKNKDLYYDALAQAQTGWHEGTEDVVPFIKYLLGTILAAYKDFEDRVVLVETKLSALEMVRRASKNRIEMCIRDRHHGAYEEAASMFAGTFDIPLRQQLLLQEGNIPLFRNH